MGMEIAVDNMDDLCDLMCNNRLPGRKRKMDRVIYDVRIYANGVVDRLIDLKENRKADLSDNEKEAVNDAINLILHNIKEIVRE